MGSADVLVGRQHVVDPLCRSIQWYFEEGRGEVDIVVPQELG